MVMILGGKWSDKRTVEKFYVAVVKAVLLFGLDIWVVTPQLEKSFSGFHNQAVQRVVGMGLERQLNIIWVYPPIGATLSRVVLEEIRVNIVNLQKTVTPHIVSCTIM